MFLQVGPARAGYIDTMSELRNSPVKDAQNEASVEPVGNLAIVSATTRVQSTKRFNIIK